MGAHEPVAADINFVIIMAGVEAADANSRVIDDDTARRIAELMPGGLFSASQLLVDSGGIQPASMLAELEAELGRPELSWLDRKLYSHLTRYVMLHGYREPVSDWG